MHSIRTYILRPLNKPWRDIRAKSIFGHTAIGCEGLEDMLDSSACAVLCWDAVTRKLADGEPGRWCCEVDAAVIIPLISSIHICPRPIPVRIMPVLLNAQ